MTWTDLMLFIAQIIFAGVCYFFGYQACAAKHRNGRKDPGICK